MRYKIEIIVCNVVVNDNALLIFIPESVLLPLLASKRTCLLKLLQNISLHVTSFHRLLNIHGMSCLLRLLIGDSVLRFFLGSAKDLLFYVVFRRDYVAEYVYVS